MKATLKRVRSISLEKMPGKSFLILLASIGFALSLLGVAGEGYVPESIFDVFAVLAIIVMGCSAVFLAASGVLALARWATAPLDC